MQALHHPGAGAGVSVGVGVGRDSNQHQVSTASASASEDDSESQPKSEASQKSPTGFSSVGSPAGSVTSPLTPNQVGFCVLCLDSKALFIEKLLSYGFKLKLNSLLKNETFHFN